MLRMIGSAICFAAGFFLSKGVVYFLPIFAIGLLFIMSQNKISNIKTKESEKFINLVEANRLLETELGASNRLTKERETSIKDLQSTIEMYKKRVKKLTIQKNMEKVPSDSDSVDDLIKGYNDAKKITNK